MANKMPTLSKIRNILWEILPVLFFIVYAGSFLTGCSTSLKNHSQSPRMGELKIAVLPSAMWAEDDTNDEALACCGLVACVSCGVLVCNNNQMTGGSDGFYTTTSLPFTRSVASAFSRYKNAVLIDQKTIRDGIKKEHLSAYNIFPKNYSETFGRYETKKTPSPDYRKLFDLGKRLGADMVVISRMVTNPVIPFYPVTLTPAKENVFLTIDIMALDIKNREIIIFDTEDREDTKQTIARFSKTLNYTVSMPGYAVIKNRFYEKCADRAVAAMAKKMNFHPVIVSEIKKDID